MSVHRMQQVRGWLVVSLLLGAVACSSGDKSGGSADGGSADGGFADAGEVGGDGGSGTDGGSDPDAEADAIGHTDYAGANRDADSDIEEDVDLSQPPTSRMDGFPTQFTQSSARWTRGVSSMPSRRPRSKCRIFARVRCW
jgi:hypothetical protein